MTVLARWLCAHGHHRYQDYWVDSPACYQISVMVRKRCCRCGDEIIGMRARPHAEIMQHAKLNGCPDPR